MRDMTTDEVMFRAILENKAHEYLGRYRSSGLDTNLVTIPKERVLSRATTHVRGYSPHENIDYYRQHVEIYYYYCELL